MLEKIKTTLYCIAFCWGWVCTYTGVSQESIYILTALMVFDTITGYIKVAVLGGHPTSTRLSWGIASKLVLLLVPFTIVLSTKYLGLNLLGLASASIITMSVSEAISVITNIYIIRTGKELKEFDLISGMLKKIRETLINVLKQG